MYEKFLNGRSPLRLLEKGLHGGLGRGNLGLVIAGHGVGKTSLLVGVALDELLRSGRVLHVSTAHTISHVRAHYDAVFEELAATTELEDEVRVHAEIERRRSIRVYAPSALTASKLREAVQLETEAGSKPSLLILEGRDLEAVPRDDIVDLRALARELPAEIWLSAASAEERVAAIPDSIRQIEDLVSVILTLEPDRKGVALRALKYHDNPDLADLHVALDPRTLLLARS